MASILVLTQRIPYPPDKGEKIRSFQFIQRWAKDHQLHLGCFIDDANDWQHVKKLEQYCNTSCFIGINKKLAYFKLASGLLKNKPLSVAFFFDKKFQHWVDETIKRVKPDILIIFSSAMAQYVVERHRVSGIQIMDFVDVDSDKWAQYAQKSHFPMKWVYTREARVLLEYDRHVARHMDASVFVTENETELFNHLAPESKAKSYTVSNGVNLDYFNDSHHFDEPSNNKGAYLVFTGTMDYKPNVDAVVWMVKKVLPIVWQKEPQVRLYIVGASPSNKVKILGENDDRVIVTGRVPDVRPYISHAIAAVAPLRIARGIQNKVLEAMAMSKITIVTPFALEGIEAEPGKELLLAEDEHSFAKYIFDVLGKNVSQDIAIAARACMEKKYSWQSKYKQYDELIRTLS